MCFKWFKRLNTATSTVMTEVIIAVMRQSWGLVTAWSQTGAVLKKDPSLARTFWTAFGPILPYFSVFHAGDRVTIV